MIFIFMKPSQRQYYDLESNLDRVHVFVDVSPSNSIAIQDNGSLKELLRIYRMFATSGNLSFSSVIVEILKSLRVRISYKNGLSR